MTQSLIESKRECINSSNKFFLIETRLYIVREI